MKKGKIIIGVMFVISVIFQAIYFSGGYQYMFAVGLNPENRSFSVAENIIYILIPILFICFFVSGTYYEITRGYGKLMIIRSYSKTRLILKSIIKIFLFVLAFTLIQFAVYQILISSFTPTGMNPFLLMLMYFTALSALVLLQCFLELYISPQTANIIIFIYTFLSYYTVQVIPDELLPKMTKILLFPCLMFGMKNGISNGTEYVPHFIALIAINALIVVLSIRRFNKTDIF